MKEVLDEAKLDDPDIDNSGFLPKSTGKDDDSCSSESCQVLDDMSIQSDDSSCEAQDNTNDKKGMDISPNEEENTEREAQFGYMVDAIQGNQELRSSLNTSHAKLYEVDNGERKIPVSWETHYRHRGWELRMMNRYEYHSIVRVEEKKSEKDSEGVTMKRGRKGNGRYEFDMQHPLHASHLQVLRSKQFTCILTGKKPPRHPGPEPRRRK